MKRFIRLSPGFSKKLENLAAAVALHVAHCGFFRSPITRRDHGRNGPGVVNELGRLKTCTMRSCGRSCDLAAKMGWMTLAEKGKMLKIHPLPESIFRECSVARRIDKPFHYERHAQQRMKQRCISQQQIERAISDPHSRRPAKRRGAIYVEHKINSTEKVCVIYEETPNFIRVVSTWMDHA